MSGTGLARRFWRNVGRAGPRACVAGAYLAVIGDQRFDAGPRLVARAISWQLVGPKVEEPGHVHVDCLDGSGRHVVEPAVRQCAGRKSAIT